jgi:KDO2-lipid IV(A) lauroyltransferase
MPAAVKPVRSVPEAREAASAPRTQANKANADRRQVLDNKRTAEIADFAPQRFQTLATAEAKPELSPGETDSRAAAPLSFPAIPEWGADCLGDGGSALDTRWGLAQSASPAGEPIGFGRPMTSQELRFRLEYVGFRVVQAAASALPLAFVSPASGLVWRAIAPLLHRQERALRNLALAYPEMPLTERKRLAAEMWENLGRTFAESFHLKEIVAKGRIRFEPEALFDDVVRGGSCVVCGLHLGNWELLAASAKRVGVKVTGVYQRLSNPYVDAETQKLRAFLYEGGLLPKTPVTARTLLRTAQEGGYPALLADLRDDRGAKVAFFGHPARSSTFPALLARTTGLPLYAGAVYRRPKVHFVIRAAHVPIPRTNDRAADAIAGTAALQAQFEAFIREAPEQWMWAHRRWD